MKYDIKRVANMIGGRQGWAYICNSTRFAVLMADKDMPQEYGEEYQTFGQVRVIKTYKDGSETAITGTLELDNGKWKIGCGGVGIHAGFGFSDAMELVNNANMPIVRKDDVVAIAQFSKKESFISLMLYKIGNVDPHCTTVTSLTPLSDEEMEQVMKDAERWCDR